MRHMKSLSLALLAGLGLACAAQAQSLGDLKSLGGISKNLGGAGNAALASTSIPTPASAGNAAGLLSYCVKNHYLSDDSKLGKLKQQLLGKQSGQGSDTAAAKNDPEYQDGAKGILHGNNGQSLDLSNLGGQYSQYKDKLIQQGCKLVLDKGKSLL